MEREGQDEATAWLPQPVVHHDPCDLGRTSGIYDAARSIIEAIPGIQFAEMAYNRELSFCCYGGGGDGELADPELTGSVGKRRIQQVQETGVKVLISACQQCDRTWGRPPARIASASGPWTLSRWSGEQCRIADSE